MKIFLELFYDALKDSISLFPYLFFTYLILEALEHKAILINKIALLKKNILSPIIASFLALIPQCGVCVSASNFYSAGVISLGSLIAVFLSSSDEMLPIFISTGLPVITIIKILTFKVAIGCLFGLLIDLFFIKQTDTKPHINSLCQQMDCHCEKGLIYSTLRHSFQIFLFILSVSLIFNSLIYFVGLEEIKKSVFENTYFAVLIATLIGLIPNCASSVVLTELFLNNTLTSGAFLSGVLSNSGLGLLVLFRLNRPMKDNFKIISLVFLLSFITGLAFSLTGYQF